MPWRVERVGCFGGSRVHQPGFGRRGRAPRSGPRQGSAGIVGGRSGRQTHFGHCVRIPQHEDLPRTLASRLRGACSA
eukprot:13892549-Alexandrium_andersonii.AAC.1